MRCTYQRNEPAGKHFPCACGNKICIREQFVTRMVRIENCDSHKEKDANVGLFGMAFFVTI